MDTEPFLDLTIPDEPEDYVKIKSEFCDVFVDLDANIQQLLLKAWQKHGKGFPVIVPNLQLSKGLGQFVRYACTNGFVFEFHPDLLSKAPPTVLHAIIAHEVAHAYIMERDGHNVFFYSGDLLLGPRHEAETIRLAVEWGYDHDAAADWVRENIH